MPFRLGMYELFKGGVNMTEIFEALKMLLTHIPKVIEYYSVTGLTVLPIENWPEAVYDVVYLLGTRVIPLLLAYFVLP